MTRRSSWRIPIRLNIKLNCGGKSLPGVITNLSENGMFISIEEPGTPLDERFEIVLSHEGETMELPVKLVRSVKAEGLDNGIGVEVIEPPGTYLGYVENLLYTL